MRTENVLVLRRPDPAGSRFFTLKVFSMNIEIFVAVVAALITYRVLSPLIDSFNPLAYATKAKVSEGVARSAGAASGNAQ